MAFGPAVTGPAFFLENDDFIVAFVLDDLGGHLGGLAAFSEQDIIALEIDGIAFFHIELFDAQGVIFGDFVLFSACADDCKHDKSLVYSDQITRALYTRILPSQENAYREFKSFSCTLKSVSSVNHLSKPFILNRAPRSYIVIHGDDEAKTITKLVWSLVGAADVKLENSVDKQDLISKSSGALLTIIAFLDDPDILQMGIDVAKNPDLIGDIMGIARAAETSRRVEILGTGFDSVFNLEMIQQPSFKPILSRKLEKARIRQTNHILQEEYRRFRAALTASPDAFIVLDHERNIFFVSEHYKRAYPALGSKLIRGLPVMEAFELARVEQGVKDDDPRYLPMKRFWEVLQGQIEFTMESGRIWQIKAAPLPEGQGTIVTTTDITEIVSQQKVIEEKSRLLAEALEKEKEASALQKQFIGMVSHEFRTPLAIIDGNAQLVQRLGGDSITEIHNRCKTMRSAVSRLVHMMESVLSSSMLKTGRLDPDLQEFDLGELIAELCDEHAMLSQPDVITWDVSGLTGNVLLDRKMMTLIITNLLSNAVKYTRDQPRIHVTAAHGPEGVVVMGVTDNGIGIPENELGRVFERYYRASTSIGIAGTGIGLNLVQDLLGLQNGKISVQSTVGKGTCFTVIFERPF